MIDQNSQFYAILTNIGVAKQANADALGIGWKITQMGVGDANGADPQPDAKQKALINEWRRAPLNQLKQAPTNPAIIIAEQVIPAEVGGNGFAKSAFTMRTTILWQSPIARRHSSRCWLKAQAGPKWYA
ncbi:Phage-related tail fiber protein-like protein [Pseudomonas savastanoi]|uniref:Phage-related tail fiber protein-like protein n=1 Tax=Pseudomonas savastanoi TaxID=29438 RepID=A0A3M5GCU5_PSESS|nr:Phage-related tail fiber protein-like protein [Pseudomonas savastanoi]